MSLEGEDDALLLYVGGGGVARILQARQRLLGEWEVLEGADGLTAVTLVLSSQAGRCLIYPGILRQLRLPPQLHLVLSLPMRVFMVIFMLLSLTMVFVFRRHGSSEKYQ